MGVYHFDARLLAAFALGVAAFVAQPAEASIMPVDSRAALNGDVTVSWDLFGEAGTLEGTPIFRTAGPITVSVGSSGGSLSRVDGGFGFEEGEPLLRDDFNSVETFSIGFQENVRGFGFDLQATAPSAPEFTGRIKIFGDDFEQIGEILFSGNIEGQPIFVGGLSDTPDISTLFIEIDDLAPFGDPAGAAAISRMDVVVGNRDSKPVPVPATLALLLVPLAGFALSLGRIRTV